MRCNSLSSRAEHGLHRVIPHRSTAQCAQVTNPQHVSHRTRSFVASQVTQPRTVVPMSSGRARVVAAAGPAARCAATGVFFAADAAAAGTGLVPVATGKSADGAAALPLGATAAGPLIAAGVRGSGAGLALGATTLAARARAGWDEERAPVGARLSTAGQILSRSGCLWQSRPTSATRTPGPASSDEHPCECKWQIGTSQRDPSGRRATHLQTAGCLQPTTLVHISAPFGAPGSLRPATTSAEPAGSAAPSTPALTACVVLEPPRPTALAPAPPTPELGPADAAP